MAAMAGTLRLGNQVATSGEGASSDKDASSPNAASNAESQDAAKAGDRSRVLRVEVNGLLHDWFNVEEMADVLRSTSFASTLRENVARYFGVPLEKQAIYDEDGLLTTDVDFRRALQRVNPKLYVYDLSQMNNDLRDRTCEELEKIEADVEQSWQHFGARSARSRVSLPAEGMTGGTYDADNTRPATKETVAEDTLCASADDSNCRGQSRVDLDTTRREYEEIADRYPPEVSPEVQPQVFMQGKAVGMTSAALVGGFGTPVAPIAGGPSPRCGTLRAASAGPGGQQSARRCSVTGAVTSCSSTLPGVPIVGGPPASSRQLPAGAISVHGPHGAPLTLPIAQKANATSWVPLVAPADPRRQSATADCGYNISPRLTPTPANAVSAPPQTPPRWPSASPHHAGGVVQQRTPGVPQAATPLSVRGNPGSCSVAPAVSPPVPGLTRVESGPHPLRQARASCSGHTCSGPLVTAAAAVRGNPAIGGIAAGERSLSSARLTPTPQQQRSTTPTPHTPHNVSQPQFQPSFAQQAPYVAPPAGVRLSSAAVQGAAAISQAPAPGLLWQAGRSTTPRRLTQVPSAPSTQPPGWPGAGFAATPQRSVTPAGVTPSARPASVTASAKRGVSRGRVEASKAPDTHVRALNFNDWSQQPAAQQQS